MDLFEAGPGGPTLCLERTFSKTLWDALCSVYRRLGFDSLKDEVFRQLVVARVIEPTSKLDTIRVLADLGLDAPSYSGINRALERVVKEDYRGALSTQCFQKATPSSLSLVLYDVTTLYFEIQKEDGYRRPGLSKERRLEPQITLGLLVDRNGFPLEIQSFEGNKAETKTIVPVLRSFSERHGLEDVTVVADAAMLSGENLTALKGAGISLHRRLPARQDPLRDRRVSEERRGRALRQPGLRRRLDHDHRGQEAGTPGHLPVPRQTRGLRPLEHRKDACQGAEDDRRDIRVQTQPLPKDHGSRPRDQLCARGGGETQGRHQGLRHQSRYPGLRSDRRLSSALSGGEVLPHGQIGLEGQARLPSQARGDRGAPDGGLRGTRPHSLHGGRDRTQHQEVHQHAEASQDGRIARQRQAPDRSSAPAAQRASTDRRSARFRMWFLIRLSQVLQTRAVGELRHRRLPDRDFGDADSFRQ
ncbi:MAG: IS1634 family transposase [Coriobacteriia bacterium]